MRKKPAKRTILAILGVLVAAYIGYGLIRPMTMKKARARRIQPTEMVNGFPRGFSITFTNPPGTGSMPRGAQ